MEERKRHFTFGLSSLVEAVCSYPMLHVDLNPFEILETARVKRMERLSHYVCVSVCKIKRERKKYKIEGARLCVCVLKVTGWCILWVNKRVC